MRKKDDGEIDFGSGENIGRSLPRSPQSSRMALLNDQQIVIFDKEPLSVKVMNATGEIALSYELKIAGKEGSIYAPIISADGLHFGGTIDVGPKSIFSPSRSYVFVGKVQVQAPVLAFEVPWPAPSGNSVFVSPYGDRLGIVSGVKLSVVSIPGGAASSN
jgi:hypothetical protein